MQSSGIGWAGFAVAALVGLSTAPVDARESVSPSTLRVTTREKICVTNGIVSALSDGRLAVDSASSRAVVRGAAGDIAEIRFRYLGPSADSKPLASGELRRQIGLKLRAQDTCNLLYVMWHIEPDTKIAVSVKRNPAQHSHAECHAHGYTTFRPTAFVALPAIRSGESHALRAELRDRELTVFADGRLVWSGHIGETISEIDGPVGFRTDNARFEFEYLTTAGAVSSNRATAETVNHCEVGPGD